VLIITRRAGEKIMVGDEVVLHVIEVAGGGVRIGIEAPRSTPVFREEIWHALRREREAARGFPPPAAEFPAPADGYRPA
jgi:carbon storage regulator